MKKIGFVISILICSTLFSSAQNEGNIWYFGQNAGIDFNSGIPVPLANGQLTTLEGCASISDANGDLLFYTDGMIVYNRNHTLMPNGIGLLGNSSSTQSAIIVKKPASSTIYYIFTVDGVTGGGSLGANQGLHYSEVDMTLDGGFGNVTTNKNIQLFTYACEKVTAVIHQNGSDFWIISRLENSNTYHSYLLSALGVNIIPTITNIGPFYNETVGYLKGSADGRKIAAANGWNFNTSKSWNLIDFDNNTGILSNLMSFETPNAAYGIEFSPNGNLVYVSDWYDNGNIYQYDLLAGDSVAIQNSELLISGTGLSEGAALQIAPDNKIYHVAETWYGASQLGVINNPNILGIGCNYDPNGVNLIAGTSGQLGLPTFYSCIFLSNTIDFTNLCYGDSTYFRPTNTSLDSLSWDFGDINSGNSNISSNDSTYHIFSDTGNFDVTLYSYLNGITDTLVTPIYINTLPDLNLGNDTVICEGETLTLDATVQNATYLWQDNSTAASYTVSSEKDYFVEVTANGCSSSDTIHVTYNPLPNAIISGNYEVCDGEQVFINVNLTGSSPFKIAYTNGNDSNVLSGNDLIIIQPEEDGLYTITNVVDQFGCVGNYSGIAEVVFYPCSLTIYTPNIFTPNSDAINEGFIPSIYDIDDVVTFNMKIFNRWGDIIYETNEKDKYWDGKFNNTIVQQGVYAYTITITDIFEELYNFKGSLYLIR